ncbi:MAG: Dna2/Cas4 domain-containing protein, partial [Rhodospirillales bacterium]|nr:Dna2/Cas4 domain-containing protein [Rhodospirillales bacterium]
QALCLEEMLEVGVPEGALFYGQPRRRQAVKFDEALRARVGETAAALHRLLAANGLPAPVDDARCEQCSLLEICGPALSRHSARAWLERTLAEEGD